MKTAAIRYFTRSRKGNTLKLAEAVAAATGLQALDVSSDLSEYTGKLFLVNAMYAADVDGAVKSFLERNRDKIGEIVNFSTSASGASTWKMIKKAADACGISLSEKEFHCRASWIFVNKGLPSEKDLKEAGELARNMMQE